MADWSLPVLVSAYTDVLTILKARDVDAFTMCIVAPTTPPTGAFRYVRASNKFQEYNGATWDDKVLAVAGGGTGGASASAARTALGIGTMGIQADSAVAITGGTITGVNLDASGFTTGTVALARGGTGASLSLGASGTILRSTGATVEFSTVGTALTALNATQLTSGTVPLARLVAITTAEMASALVSQFTNDAGYVTSATASLPIGAMVDYGGSVAPTSWLICDGSAISRSTYAALFAIISTAFGVGNGSTTFNIPDFRDKSALGTSITYSIGTSLGSVAHSHAVGTLSNDTAPTHSHSMSGTTASGSSHTHGSFTGTSDSGSSHSHTGGTTGSTEPPNHGHTFSTGATNINASSTTINEGDGTSGTVSVVTSISNANHDHSGSTDGVSSTLAHTHSGATTGNESAHTHGGGSYAVGAEASHTHAGGTLAAAAGGSHSHAISNSTATSSHAVLSTYKIIKYQ